MHHYKPRLKDKIEQPDLAPFQKELERYETVLRVRLEHLLKNHPRPTEEMLKLNENEVAKEEIINMAANRLLREKGPVQADLVANPQYQDNLALLLINTMVVKDHLDHHPDKSMLLDRQNAHLHELADSLTSLANDKDLDFDQQDKVNKLADFFRDKKAQELKEPAAQNELNSILDGMRPETLKKLKEPLADFFRKTDELAEDFAKQPPEQKDLNEGLDKQLKSFESPEPKSKGERREENAAPELSDNRYTNLLSLATNQTGAIAIPVSCNLGNGLGLLNSMRPSNPTSYDNVDAAGDNKTQTGVERNLHFSHSSSNAPLDGLKPALVEFDKEYSALPTPFNMENKKGQ